MAQGSQDGAHCVFCLYSRCHSNHYCNGDKKMRKGWKTRIEERRYFEEKLDERIDREAVRIFMAKRIEAEAQKHFAQMRINNEAH